MRKRRFFFFFLAVLVGIAAGVAYGWMLRPMFYSQANLSSLRVDFRTDYALMTAEILHREDNLEEARQRLQALGPDAPDRYASEALISAGQLGYSQSDLQLLADLVEKVAPSASATETPQAAQP